MFNSSPSILMKSVKRLAANYNALLVKNTPSKEAFSVSPSIVNWSRGLKGRYDASKKLEVSDGQVVEANYRPYSGQYLYASKALNEASGICDTFIRSQKDRVISIVGLECPQ